MKKHHSLKLQNPLNVKRNHWYFPLYSVLLLIILSFSGSVLGQTQVFSDNFNRDPIGTTGGTPTMTWTPGYLATSQGQVLTKGTSPNYSVHISSNPTTAVVGREYLTGSLSTFSSPFTSTLKNNSGDVIWTFNMGTSRAMSPYANAFDAGTWWGSAVILAMSGANPTDAATNGYAVVMTKGTTNNAFKLVRFAGGLIASANTSTIIGTSTDVAANTSWASIKVIYTPGTDTWKLYVRDDAVNASNTTAPDPSSGTLTQVGSATVDNSYTSVAMSSCGLFLNHSTNVASTNWTRYDNFKVTVTEPITWTSGWPKAENATLNGLTAKVNTSVAGTAYYVVLASGATAPSSAQVKAGLNAAGASLASNLKGSIACSAGATEYTAALSGLTAATTYDLYFVAEDGSSNLQGAPTKVSATTTSIVTSGYPKIENETLSGFTAKSNLTVSGKTYYVVLVSGATAPTSVQVKAGQDAAGSSVAKSGLITCTLANTEYSASVTGLSSYTTYDVYFVSEDASSNNLQAAPLKVSVSSNATSVFVDDFNRASVSPGGSPSMTWTAGTVATLPANEGSASMVSGSYLKISTNLAVAGTASPSRTYVTGPLSTYASPFASTLSSNTGAITWTFNAQARRPSSPPRGFDDSQTGYAVILAMTSANPTNTSTNGYAVTIKSLGVSSGTNAIRLVKFTNGLVANANITEIIVPSAGLALDDYWASVKVVYTPSSNLWALYVRDDNSVSSGADPTSGTLTQIGTVVDNTYASSTMTSCGFLWNEGAGKANTACYGASDNFKVTVDAAITFTSGWPKVENASSSGFTAKTNTNIGGTSYYVVLPSAATAPTSAQVKAGQDATGATLASNLKGSIACAAGATEYTAAITGLAASTTYDVYFVAENLAANNLQASPTKVTVNTLIIPTVSVTVGTYTYTGSAQGPNAATNTGTGSSYTFSYVGTGVTYGPSETAPLAAGTYTVTATVAANGNYSSASSAATPFSILSTGIISSDTNVSGLTLSTSSNLSVAANSNLVIDVNTNVNSVTVAPTGKLTLNLGRTLTTGSIELQSSASGTATFVDQTTNGGLTVTGTSTVQQYLSKARNWYVSSPLSAATAAVVNPQGSSNLLYWYDESKGSPSGWTLITTNASTLSPGKGYIVKPATDGVTLNFTGATVNSGTTPSMTVYRTSAPDHAGFNLIGNPYPSYLNARSVVNSSANLDKSIWYRTQINSSSTYKFDTYNTASGQFINSSGNNTYIVGTVPPMQAFWVRVSLGQSSAVVNFSNSYRTHAVADTLNPLKVKNQLAASQPSLRLQVSNGINSDETLIYSDPNATNGYDIYDSPKMSNGSTSIPELFTLADNEQLAINGLSSIPYDIEIPLGFSTGQLNNFSIKATQLNNFDSDTYIILKDYQDLNNVVEYDLTNGSAYNFTSAVISTNSRFTIIFKSRSVINDIQSGSLDAAEVVVSRNANNQIMLNYLGNLNSHTTLSVYNAMGQKILQKGLENKITILDGQLESGVYIVSISNAQKTVTKKVIVR